MKYFYTLKSYMYIFSVMDNSLCYFFLFFFLFLHTQSNRYCVNKFTYGCDNNFKLYLSNISTLNKWERLVWFSLWTTLDKFNFMLCWFYYWFYCSWFCGSCINLCTLSKTTIILFDITWHVSCCVLEILFWLSRPSKYFYRESYIWILHFYTLSSWILSLFFFFFFFLIFYHSWKWFLSLSIPSNYYLHQIIYILKSYIWTFSWILLFSFCTNTHSMFLTLGASSNLVYCVQVFYEFNQKSNANPDPHTLTFFRIFPIVSFINWIAPRCKCSENFLDNYIP